MAGLINIFLPGFGHFAGEILDLFTKENMDKVVAGVKKISGFDLLTQENMDKVVANVKTLSGYDLLTQENMDKVVANVKKISGFDLLTQENMDKVVANVKKISGFDLLTQEKMDQAVANVKHLMGLDLLTKENLKTVFEGVVNLSTLGINQTDIDSAFKSTKRFFSSSGSGDLSDVLWNKGFAEPIKFLTNYKFPKPNITIPEIKVSKIEVGDLTSLNGVAETIKGHFSGLEATANGFSNGLENAVAVFKTQMDKIFGQDFVTKFSEAIKKSFTLGIEIGGTTGEIIKKIFGATGGLVTNDGIQRFASGGAVDNIPALLTPGEFVLNKGATEGIGINAASFINDTGKIPGNSTTVNIEAGAIQIEASQATGATDIAEEVLELIRRRTVDGAGIVFTEGLRAS